MIDEQAEVVRQIYSWYTGPDEYSIGKIARRLNEEEIAPPAGSKWGTSSVRRILGYPCYKGTTYYNRHQTDYTPIGLPKHAGPGRLTSARHIKRPESEWIEISVPAIISEVTWDMAQKRFEMNARFSARNSKRIYLLKGLLVCGICERTLQGRAQRGITYYRCPGGGKKRASGVPKHRCTLRADSCEDAIWQQLADLLNQPSQIKLAWQAHQATQKPHDYVRWQKRIKELAAQRQRLLDAYQAGVISLDELSRRQNPIKSERLQLEAKLANASLATATTIRLEDFQRKIQQALAASVRKIQQQLIRLLIDRIVVADKILTVHHLIPLMNESLLRPSLAKA